MNGNTELKELLTAINSKLDAMDEKQKALNEVAENLSPYIWVLDYMSCVITRMDPRRLLNNGPEIREIQDGPEYEMHLEK
jgi:hypothetical protein